MKRLTFLNVVGAGLILCGLVTVRAPENDSEQAVIDALKSLDFSQLPEMEVSLDATFDVFDSPRSHAPRSALYTSPTAPL